MSVRAREIATYTSATQAFSSLGGYIGASFELSGGTQPEEINAGRLNSATFSTLGVQPILGRIFTPQEEDARQPVAVVSYALWTNRFHRDSQVLGSTIVLNREPYSVIGVMPRDFEFPLQFGRLDQAQVWLPLSLTPDELSEQHSGFLGIPDDCPAQGWSDSAASRSGCRPRSAAGDARFSGEYVGDPHSR
jgi:putative ABC transport system permease protein